MVHCLRKQRCDENALCIK